MLQCSVGVRQTIQAGVTDMAGRSRAGNGHPVERLAAVAGEMAKTGVKGGEMGVAAAQTIGYRTAMMAAAMGNPVDLANPEFVRMGSEKVEAAVEAVHAVAKGMEELYHAWVALSTGQSQAALAMLGGLGTVRTPADLLMLQSRSVTEAMDAGIHASLRFVEAASALTTAGLNPAYRKVRANAKRLARQHG